MDIFQSKDRLTQLVTDEDYDMLFTKIAEEQKPESFAGLRNKVAELSNNNEVVLERYDSWIHSIELDTNRIKNLIK